MKDVNIYQKIHEATQLPISTIKARVYRSKNPNKAKARDRRALLSISEEVAFVHFLKASSESGIPFTPSTAFQIAKFAFPALESANKHWIYDFVGRHHKMLPIRTATSLADSRSGETLLDPIYVFAHKMNYVMQSGVRSRQVMNVDECKFDIQTRWKVIGSAQLKKQYSIHCRKGAKLSITPFIDASGSLLMSVYGISGSVTEKGVLVKVPENLQVGAVTRSRCTRYYFGNKTAMQNAETFTATIQHFCDWYRLHRPEEPGYLIMDNLGCHKQPHLVDMAKKVGIRLIFLPPGMTSYVQPLDCGPFGLLKRLFRELVAKQCVLSTAISGESGNVPSRLETALSIEAQAFNTNTNKYAFSNTHFWPWDCKQFIETCKTEIAATSSVENEANVTKLVLSLLDIAKNHVPSPQKSIRVKKNHLFDGQEMLQHIDVQETAKRNREEREKRSKAAKEKKAAKAKQLKEENRQLKQDNASKNRRIKVLEQQLRKATRENTKTMQRSYVMFEKESSCLDCLKNPKDKSRWFFQKNMKGGLCPRCFKKRYAAVAD